MLAVTPLDPLRSLGLFSRSPRLAQAPGRVRRRGRPDSSEAVGAEGAANSTPVLPAGMLKLAEAVDSAAVELERNAAGPQLEDYRRAVRRFLDAALRESTRVDSETSAGLAQRIFACITRCDLLLAELADAVLGRQRDNAQLRRLTMQLRGILVDLYR